MSRADNEDKPIIAGAPRLNLFDDRWSEMMIGDLLAENTRLRAELAAARARVAALEGRARPVPAAIQALAAPENRRGRGRPRKKDGPVESAAKRLGREFGLSSATMELIGIIMAAAKRDPEKFGHLLERLGREGKVRPVYREFQRLKAEG